MDENEIKRRVKNELQRREGIRMRMSYRAKRD
jgi:hypothetical protein